MKILTVADEESPIYYDYYKPGKLHEFDLILACGDLSASYLEFLVTMARCPLLYVHGNHDDSYEKKPPEGCICIEDTIYNYNGLRIMGLGGSQRYRPNGKNMYTEREMRFRILKMQFQLWKNKGFDILLTHAPARGINDLDDLPHRGFESFNSLMDSYQPKYMIHGHIHRNYGVKIPQITQVGNTMVVNAFEYCKLEI
ncbi:MAG: metallophosphoesterase family protein [Lachnospiraceae bacterium]|nr:metallophosphoesterase family protein [Lachnospiraceae bacterium]